MILKVLTRLDVTPEAAWSLVKKTTTFQYVTRGVLRFYVGTELPEEWHAGQTIRSRLVLFGFLPAWVHELEVIAVDDAQRELQTAEKGCLLRRWDHTLSVGTDAASGCTYTDTVALEAGLLTPLVWLMAWCFFRYRQRRLRRLVWLQSEVSTRKRSDHA